MGRILLNYYKKAKELGGMKAELKLAILTKVPSKKAANIPDSPEIIEKFEESFKVITKQFD